EFNNLVNATKLFLSGDHYVYIDIRNNEVFLDLLNKTIDDSNAKHLGPNDQIYKELIMSSTRKENEAIPEDHIYHSEFSMHITCKNIKAPNGFYLDKNKRQSKYL
ncbi:17906_t:CDS:2, partial [Racocetra fulgida]